MRKIVRFKLLAIFCLILAATGLCASAYRLSSGDINVINGRGGIVVCQSIIAYTLVLFCISPFTKQIEVKQRWVARQRAHGWALLGVQLNLMIDALVVPPSDESADTFFLILIAFILSLVTIRIWLSTAEKYTLVDEKCQLV